MGGKIVVSVEPSPDDSAAPFALKPLFGTVGALGAGVVQSIDNQSATNNATGTASIKWRGTSITT